jgi:predicted DNA-binding transcriptional regulator YafY
MSHPRKDRSRSDESDRRGSDTSTFLKRSLMLQGELQKRAYPNASTLAAMCGCSRSTAMRTIDRLRYEFGVPIEYDESNRGYYLTNPQFSFASLPPDRDELVALILLREIASMIDDATVRAAISSLWIRTTNGRADIDRDLELIRSRFTVDGASVAKLPSVDIVRLVFLCHQGQMVQVRYRSPWSHERERLLSGRFQKLHLYDGTLYGLFADIHGRKHVLNLSFILGLQEISQHSNEGLEGADGSSQSGIEWQDGVGAWSGGNPEIIEITLAAPGSRYYASQTWHSQQEDCWDGDTLIRRFPGTMSLDLLRRVLSLGRFVVAVKPTTILEQLREDVRNLAQLCSEDSIVIK